jgi:hypothetical protein
MDRRTSRLVTTIALIGMVVLVAVLFVLSRGSL